MANYSNLKAAINAVIKQNGQGEITGEVMNQVLTAMVNSLGSNYQFAGVATPSTNPGTPDQNVFYMATQAGTYTNFSAIVLQAGISILLWNGSWSSETFFTIDAVPTAGSNNFVTSGGVQNELALGAVYDVSAKNPNAGVNNDGKWESLSALLSDDNLSTLIPTAYRKGGMSIKFIQSSDNKYVQFRYMSSSTAVADFINVANWQGVDDVPTAGSDNIAKSGEVAKGIFDYAMMLCKNFDFSGGDAIPFITENSARISENGVKISGSGYDIAKFAIDGRKIYKINFPSGSDYCSPMAFVDDNNQVIDYISAGAVSATTRVVAFPNCKGNIWISAAHSRFSGVSVTAVDINDNLILNFQDNSIDLSKLKNDAIQSYPTAQVVKLQTSDGVTKYVGRIALNIGNIITTQEQNTITIDVLTNLGVNSGDILYIKLSWTGNVERIRVRDEHDNNLRTSVVSGTEYMLTIASAFNTLRLEFKNANITDVVLSVDTKLSSVIKQLQTSSNQYGTAIELQKNAFAMFVERNTNAFKSVDVNAANSRFTAILQQGVYVFKVFSESAGTIKKLALQNGTTELLRFAGEASIAAGSTLYYIVDNTFSNTNAIGYNTTVPISISIYAVQEVAIADKVKSILGSTLEDKSGTLTWTDGKRLQYYSETDIRTPDHEGSQLSNAFLMQKGNLLILDRGTSNLPTLSICGCDSNGEHRYYIGNTKNLKQFRFVAPKDMYIRISIESGTNVQYYSVSAESDVFDNIFADGMAFPKENTEMLLQNVAQREYISTSAKAKNLVLLHFSDIHGQIINMGRILEFNQRFKKLGDDAQLHSYIDDILSTGDVCPQQFSDYVQAFDDLEGYDKVLQTIGNHDVYNAHGDAPSSDYSDPAYWATAQEKYERYMANISQWDVVQPAGAGEAGYYPCYYYKDYTDEAIRLIVLDAMAYDAVQHTWLVNTLLSARTASTPYHVVIADHFIPAQASNDYNGFNTPFNSLVNDMGNPFGTTRLSYLDGETRIYAADAVDDFIAAGGIFVCWLAGHMHYDLVGKLDSHPNQMYIAVSTADVNGVMRHDARSTQLESIDCFNIVGIDTFSKHIKVVRIGAQWDRWVRKRETMLLDYENKTLLYTS